jgi:hypothetical protein
VSQGPHTAQGQDVSFPYMQFGDKLTPRQLRIAGVAGPRTAHHTLNIALRVILQTRTSNVQYNCHWKKLMHRVNTGVRVMCHTTPIPGNGLSLRWWSIPHGHQPRLMMAMIPTSRLPSKPAFARPTPRSQVHLLIPRPLEPKNVRFPIRAQAHSLISLLPLPLHSRPYQPLQVTISRRWSLTLL